MTSTKEVPCYECGESIQVSGAFDVIMDLDGDLCSTCLYHLPDDVPCTYRVRDLTAHERLSEVEAYRREAESDHWYDCMGRGYRVVRHLYRRLTHQYR